MEVTSGELEVIALDHCFTRAPKGSHHTDPLGMDWVGIPSEQPQVALER